jgi:hypothetical protein
MGPSPTDRGPADRAGLVVLDRVDPVDLAVLGRVGLVDLGRAGLGRAGLVVTGRAGRAGLVVMDLAALGDPVGLGPVGQVDLVGPADIRALADRAGPVVLDRVDPVDLAGRVDPVDLAGLDLGNQGMDPAGRVDLGVPVGHTHPGVSTTGVAPRWAAPGTCRTGSARRITGRRLRPGNTDSAGTVGVPPVLRRLSGTDHHLQVAGVGLRLPVVGTVHGMVRRVTGASRSVITGRSITTGTTRSRCSTRYSVDGASGSSVSGSRCTDLTASTPD